MTTAPHPTDWRDCPVPSCDHPAHWPDAARPASRYPSTADLAAFRRSYRLDPTDPRSVPGDALRYHASPPGWTMDLGGAWPHEREAGIGYRVALDASYTVAPEVLHPQTVARHEAAAMRSRAYRRMQDDARPGALYLPLLDLIHHTGAYTGPWAEELRYGAPYIFHDPDPARR